MKHFLFVTEGIDDVGLLSGIISQIAFIQEVKKLDMLDDFWTKIIPNKFPFDGNRLSRVTPIPCFYQGNDISIAIKVAEGENKIFNEIDNILSTYNISDLSDLNRIFILCDADSLDASTKMEKLINAAESDSDITISINITDNKIFFKGIEIELLTYVFPNNKDSGNLETLLIKLAQIKYSDLLKGSIHYIDSVSDNYQKQIGNHKDKAIIGCICNVLRPAASNNISLKNDNWVCSETKNTDILQDLYSKIIKFIT